MTPALHRPPPSGGAHKPYNTGHGRGPWVTLAFPYPTLLLQRQNPLRLRDAMEEPTLPVPQATMSATLAAGRHQGPTAESQEAMMRARGHGMVPLPEMVE